MKRSREIARDLRAYAGAGMRPDFASKLLDAAAELEALAAARRETASGAE